MTNSTITKSSRNRAACIEENKGVETAVILASATPLGVATMATFPLSLIALGKIRIKQFEDTLTLRPEAKGN